jgi:prevent-host-death family protein
MLTISSSEFKAKCLKLMEEVSHSHEEILVTKRGKPMVKVTPIISEQESLFGSMRGTVSIKKDIVSYSLDDMWEAEADADV